MKITIGAVSNFQEFEKELRLIKSSMLINGLVENFVALHGKLGNETERNLTRVKKKWLSLYP
jgi:hypothetical protein